MEKIGVTTVTRLIQCLRSAGPRMLSGSRLAEDLGLSRAAVHKHIVRLRVRGYRITGTTNAGYRLESVPDLVDMPFRGTNLGRYFFASPVLPSTQDEAKRRAVSGAPQGTLILAERQTAGRGRLGRHWMSPPGGLWYSLVLRPTLRPEQVPALILVAALDWARTIRKFTGLPAQVKWPNDIWIRGRKAAGFLAEMSSELDRVHWVVLGAGINVNNRPPAGTTVRAVSLKSATGRDWSRQDLLVAWLKTFAKSYTLFRRSGFEPFRQLYRKFSCLEGHQVTFETGRGKGQGKVTGIDSLGRLIIQNEEGERALLSGEIALLRA